MTSERYRIVNDAHVYFVTYSIVEWLPVFVADEPCRVVTDSLTYCRQEKHLAVNSYVIMPTHMHAIVFDQEFDNDRLLATLKDFRKFTGRALTDYCSERRSPVFRETLTRAATQDRKRRFWQPSRHAEAILSANFWEQKLDYIHDNPCRKGLVFRPEHWRFSSAAFYLSDGEATFDVGIDPLDWT